VFYQKEESLKILKIFTENELIRDKLNQTDYYIKESLIFL